MVLFFFNDNENIIIKYVLDKNSLPNHHLITSICLDGVYYGFYKNLPDLEKNKGFLYTGECLEIPEMYKNEYNLLRQYQSVPLAQNKLTKYFLPNNIIIKKIQDFFNNTTDQQFKVNCLFHTDKNPSLNICIDLNLFYCFSCKSSGSLAKLVACLKV